MKYCRLLRLLNDHRPEIYKGCPKVMPELKALLFDVDGTLADTERDGHRVAFNPTRLKKPAWTGTGQPKLYG